MDFLPSKVKLTRCVSGRFLIVVEAIAAAGEVTQDGVIDAQAPAAQVEHVHAVVAQLAVAPVPEPVPVVMQVVVVEGPAWCGALPEVVVELLGRRCQLALADGAAEVVVVPDWAR